LQEPWRLRLLEIGSHRSMWQPAVKEKNSSSNEGSSGLKRGWYRRAVTATVLRVVTAVFGQS